MNTYKWVGLAVPIGLVVLVVFMKARQHAELREEWASPDRPAIVTIEARKQQFLALQEVEGLATDFASLLEDTAKLTHRLKKGDSPTVAAALNNLGIIYAARGEYEKAISMFEQSRRLITKYLGAEHVDAAIVDSNIRTANANKQKSVLSSRI